MEHQLSHLFYLRKSKRTRDKLCPIYLRITVNGQRIDDSVRRYVDPCYWIKGAGRLKKSTEEGRQINLYLDSLTAKIHRLERELVQDGKEITFLDFKSAWDGESGNPKMLLEIFQQHNDKVAELIKIGEGAPGTLERYNKARDHVRDFVSDTYKCSDLNIRHLNYEFVSNFEFWLKTARKCAHNTAMKYISNLKKIVNLCRRNGWLTKDPFFGYKVTKHDVVKEPLTSQELAAIAIKPFSCDRLNIVRDIFLFSCFTGLAYADTKKLEVSEIRVGVDGEIWIITKRQKTDTLSRIPLLPFPMQIIEKYKNHPARTVSGRVLPILSNQKMNAYLKEIGDLCQIQKPLTYHIARHTFATVALQNGIPMETVRDLLGHRNLKTTQAYAKVNDIKISKDMQKLRRKPNFLGNAGQFR